MGLCELALNDVIDAHKSPPLKYEVFVCVVNTGDVMVMSIHAFRTASRHVTSAAPQVGADYWCIRFDGKKTC